MPLRATLCFHSWMVSVATIRSRWTFQTLRKLPPDSHRKFSLHSHVVCSQESWCHLSACYDFHLLIYAPRLYRRLCGRCLCNVERKAPSRWRLEESLCQLQTVQLVDEPSEMCFRLLFRKILEVHYPLEKNRPWPCQSQSQSHLYRTPRHFKLLKRFIKKYW